MSGNEAEDLDKSCLVMDLDDQTYFEVIKFSVDITSRFPQFGWLAVKQESGPKYGAPLSCGAFITREQLVEIHVGIAKILEANPA